MLFHMLLLGLNGYAFTTLHTHIYIYTYIHYITIYHYLNLHKLLCRDDTITPYETTQNFFRGATLGLKPIIVKVFWPRHHRPRVSEFFHFEVIGGDGGVLVVLDH